MLTQKPGMVAKVEKMFRAKGKDWQYHLPLYTEISEG